MAKFLILSVDDEELTQGLIKEVLSDEHDVSLVLSGEECLRFVETEIPDLILLDVSMPGGINGFETCRQLKNIEKINNIPIIFVSGQSSEAERLEGYESGGVDYILKPFEIDNLRERVNFNLELARQSSSKTKLQRRLVDSNKSAIHALNYSNDLILVIQYYEECHNFNSTDIIARKMLSITNQLGLRAVIQIRFENDTEEFSDYGVVTPLERQVIYEQHDTGLFYQLHGYLMVNHSNISILIKNMPSQNESNQEITVEKLQETLRALNYAANKCVIKVAQRNNISSAIASTSDNDIVDIMILKLQNICENYQSSTLSTVDKIIDSLETLKQNITTETDLAAIQKELYKIIKTSKTKSTKIKNNKVDIKQIKNEIEQLLNILNH